MSTAYYEPADVRVDSGRNRLRIYNFGSHQVNHYFCGVCGIYPFHEAVLKPGHLRVNLGCVDDIVLEALEIGLVDGRAFAD